MTTSPLARRIIDRHGDTIKDALNRWVAPFSLIGNKPVFETAEFPWSEGLARRFDDIEREMQSVLANKKNVPPLGDISEDHTVLDTKRTWRTFVLYGYGYRHNGNCAACPETAALVDKIPGLISAMFSIQEPGTHLPRHTGVTKGMITCHLPLKVPSDSEKCRIDVNGRVHVWRRGEWLLFDDTYDHEVWNESNEDRVNLMIHVRRPMRGFGRWVTNFFFWAVGKSPFVQDMIKNLDALEPNGASLTDVGVPSA